MKYIKTFKSINENENEDMDMSTIGGEIPKIIYDIIDAKMDELVGHGDYRIHMGPEARIYITLHHPTDAEEANEIGEKVVDYLDQQGLGGNANTGGWHVGNSTESDVWITPPHPKN